MTSSGDPSHAGSDSQKAGVPVPRYYSQLKKAHKDRVLPELKGDDLEESFVRGARYSASVSYIPVNANNTWEQEAVPVDSP